MSPDPTPRSLPRRRRDDNRFSATLKGKIILSALGVVGLLFSSYGAGLKGGDDQNAKLQNQVHVQEQEIAAIKARQDEQYKALMQRIDDLREDVRGTRVDINGTRDEIMRILRAH